MKGIMNNPKHVTTTRMVAPDHSPDDLAEAESLRKVMLSDMIMRICFFMAELTRKVILRTILEMPRDLGRHR